MASPCGAGAPTAAAPAKSAAVTMAGAKIATFISSSTWLHDEVDEHRLAALDDIDAALQRGTEIGRALDRSDADDTHRIGELRIAHERIADRGRDVPPVHAAITPRGHALQMHDLLMISAVVVHDRGHRNAMMGQGPQRARRVHAVAVRLNVDREPAHLLVAERSADRRRQIVADARTAWAADR